MKAKGITGKGCYKEYYFVPKWFSNCFKYAIGCNTADGDCYIGFGFAKKTKTWSCGVFLTRFETGIPFWEKEMAKADFIIHFRGAL
jgi:hypothetical protein